MKRLFNIIAALTLVAGMATSCDLFKLDNQDGPNAQIYGKILDSETGEPIQVEAVIEDTRVFWGDWLLWGSIDFKGGILFATEDVSDRWEGSSEEQAWYVRFNGEYRNNMVFAGKYDINFRKLPVFQPENQRIEIKKGENNIDFKLLPLSRVEVKSMEFVGDKIVAKVIVHATDASKANTVQVLGLYSSTSNFVSRFYAVSTVTAPTGSVATEQEITLEMDAKKDGQFAEEFQYDRDHFLRVGTIVSNAMATPWGYFNATINAEGIYNYSEIYKLDWKTKKIEKYDWTTAKKN